MSLPSVRRPVMNGPSAPYAPAVEVTITSAFTLLIRLTAFPTLLPPKAASWYVSWSTILPPSCLKRAANAAVMFLK